MAGGVHGPIDHAAVSAKHALAHPWACKHAHYLQRCDMLLERVQDGLRVSCADQFNAVLLATPGGHHPLACGAKQLHWLIASLYTTHN